jgi:ankyrin repeat protein
MIDRSRRDPELRFVPPAFPCGYFLSLLGNTSGNTPLHWASLNGHLEAVKLLVQAGADPGVTNRAGHDAVYEAEVNGKEQVVEWLLTEERDSIQA